MQERHEEREGERVKVREKEKRERERERERSARSSPCLMSRKVREMEKCAVHRCMHLQMQMARRL